MLKICILVFIGKRKIQEIKINPNLFALITYHDFYFHLFIMYKFILKYLTNEEDNNIEYFKNFISILNIV